MEFPCFNTRCPNYEAGDSGCNAHSRFSVDLCTSFLHDNRYKEALEELEKFKEFANDMIQAGWDGSILDGGEIQESACKHGLLKAEERTEPCGEFCNCEEIGFPTTCYHKTYK